MTATIRPALTAGQVADILGLNRTAVYKLFTRHRHPIPHIRTGEDGETGGVRVRADTLDRWIREEEQMNTTRSGT